ncbi:hypothetical protein AGR6A_pAt30016 [Agrobacterium sp. NCPPB 925]|nr:hypothetical protein AGR6A_pAt30016 [Agrobacterium sp. NCPPB 925]
MNALLSAKVRQGEKMRITYFSSVAFITRSGGVVALKLSSFEPRTHRLAVLRPTFEPDERHRTNPLPATRR